MAGRRRSDIVAAGAAGLLVAVMVASPPCLAQGINCYVHRKDGKVWVRKGGGWLDPATVQRLELVGDAARDDTLEAWAGQRAWLLQHDPNKPVQVLALDDDMREAWVREGSLTIGFPTQRATGGEIMLRAPLRALDLDAPAEINLVQRHARELPGSDGYLYLAIDDITAGQVVVEVRGGDGSVLVDRHSMRVRDHVDIELADATYVLQLREMLNVLIGDDHATFTLSPVAQFAPDRIAALLDHVARSKVRFVRGGQEYDGDEAAAHLRRKLEAAKSERMTVEQFIEQIASRSSRTGEAYQIVVEDGSTVPAGQWMRQQAAALERARADRTEAANSPK